MTLLKRKSDLLLAALIFIFFFFFYARFAANHLTGGDAGDLATNVYFGGMAHPPGYPFFLVLARLFLKLTSLPVGLGLSLFSSFFGALGLGLFYFLLSSLLEKKLPALITVFWLGFSYLYWLLSEIQEVFALHLFLIIMALTTLFFWRKKRNWRWLVIFSLILGLEAAHHHTFVFLLPAFGWVFYQENKKHRWLQKVLTVQKIGWLGLALLVGFSFYFFSFWTIRVTHPTNWLQVLSWDSFWGLITRRIYGSFSAASTVSFSFRNGFLAIFGFLNHFYREIGVIGLGLAGWGLAYLRQKKETIWWVFFSLWLAVGGLFFMFYAGFPLSNWFFLGTVERFYAQSYPALFVLIGFGLVAASESLERMLARYRRYLHYPRLVLLALTGLFFLLPLISLRTNLVRNDFRDFKEVENFAKYFLDACPNDSIVFAHGDHAYFTTTYVRYVLGYRPDLIVLNMADVSSFYHYLNQEVVGYQEMDPQGDRLEEVVLASSRLNRPLCTNKFFNFESVGYHPGYLVGPVWVYLPTTQSLPTAEEFLALNRHLWDQIDLAGIRAEVEKRDYYFGYDLLKAYQGDLLMIAEYAFLMKEYEASNDFFNRAQESGFEESRLVRLDILQQIKLGECVRAGELIEKYDIEYEEVYTWPMIKEAYLKNCSATIDMSERE